MAQRGRGRLSTIDTLPEAAEPIVAMALQDLRQRKKPQLQILAALNGSLADLGVKSISKSGSPPMASNWRMRARSRASWPNDWMQHPRAMSACC
jgi:hypothetical protein